MDRGADELRDEIAAVRRASTYLVRALLTVAVGALLFTMANVTLFAVGEKVPWVIAWLLDPLASVTLVSILMAEGVASRHGRRAGAWVTALKWTAGIATWAMNIWTSAAALNWAGLLLHSVAPALVVLLAEATPRLRRQFAEIVTDLADELGRVEAKEQAARDRQAQKQAPRPTEAKPSRPTVKPAAVPPVADLLSRAASVRAEYASRGEKAGRVVIQRELGVPERKAKELVAELDKTPALHAVREA